MLKKTIIFIFIVTFFILAFIFIEWEKTINIIAQANFKIILGLCCLQLFSLSVTSYQWHLLLSKFKPGLPFTKVMGIHLASKFTENVTPSVKVGGEATKLYLLNKIFKFEYNRSTSLLIINKYASFLPFLLIYATVLFLTMQVLNIPSFVYHLFLALSIISALIFILYRKLANSNFSIEKNKFLNISILKKPIDFLTKAIKETKNLVTTQELFYQYSLSSIVWIIYPIHVYFILSMLNIEASFPLIAIATYSAYAASMLPLLPGGMGSYEATMILILSLNGIPPNRAMAVVILNRLVTYVFPLLISGISTSFLTFKLKFD